jgi:hypothetical protein
VKKVKEKIEKKAENFTCFICDKKFAKGDNLKKHYLRFHGDGKRNSAEIRASTNCELCQKEFTRANDLQVHLVFDHDRNEAEPYFSRRLIVCNAPNCGKMLHRSLLKGRVTICIFLDAFFTGKI